MEAERLRDIDEKVQRINQMEHREQQFSQMEQELSMLREQQQDQETTQQVIEGLRSKGLIRKTADNSINLVENWEQHQ